jgi:osmoprotectant transport system permease protein
VAAGREVSALQDLAAWLADPSHWTGTQGVPNRLLEHVGLSAAAVGLACLVAVPLALWLGHTGRGGSVAVNLANAGRAVPTFAVLVLLAIGPLGFGPQSTIAALVLFAVPPILVNGYVGMREVDRDVVEAARGVGLSPLQVVRTVELPLAVPLLLNGIRLAAVQTIATATIAALVAGGGLGAIILLGFGTQDQAAVLAGALLVAALALATELVFVLLARRVDPLARRRG